MGSPFSRSRLYSVSSASGEYSECPVIKIHGHCAPLPYKLPTPAIQTTKSAPYFSEYLLPSLQYGGCEARKTHRRNPEK